MTEKNRDLIIQLKQVRKEKGYSYQYIVDESIRIGQSVSMSTVFRVFSDGSEDLGFRYSTIRPIVCIVLGLSETEHNQAASPDEADALRILIGIKDDKLSDLQRQLDEKSAEVVRLNKIIDRLLER